MIKLRVRTLLTDDSIAVSHFCILIKYVSRCYPPPLYEQHRTAKVAIVLPVYNVERYLKECLDSILAQTYQNFTIFAVDDGSPDNSGQILDEYAQKDQRISVIHKVNGGLSSARNTGLSKIEAYDARFQYLYFLDSDDVLPSDYLWKMVDALEKHRADVAVSSVKEFSKTECIVKHSPPLAPYILNRDEFAQLYFDLADWINTSVSYRFLGNKLFRYNLVKHARFNENFKTAEDQDWLVFNVIPTLNKAILVPEAQFHYRLRKSSLSHSNKVLQDFDTFSQVLEITEKYSESARKGIQYRFIETAYAELKNSFATNDKLKQSITIHKIRKVAFKKFEFPIKFSDRRRLLFSYLPNTILECYFRKRIPRRTNNESFKTDFFE